MKTLIALVLLIALCGAPVIAQEPETFVKGPDAHGGFGGPVIRFTSMNDQVAVVVGGHGGWIIDHRFIIGGGGYGIVGDMVDVPYFNLGGRPYLTFGYGGLELQYVMQPMKRVHYSVSVLIGGGTARCRIGNRWITGNDDVFVAEPGAAIALNLTRSIRLDLGAAYRITRGVDITWMANEDLSGPAAVVAVSFGRF